MSEVIHSPPSMKHYLLPAILQKPLVEHLIAMRYGTEKTTEQPEYAREALMFYQNLMKDFPEIDLKANISAKPRVTTYGNDDKKVENQVLRSEK